jgi:hypothetical protein
MFHGEIPMPREVLPAWRGAILLPLGVMRSWLGAALAPQEECPTPDWPLATAEPVPVTG